MTDRKPHLLRNTDLAVAVDTLANQAKGGSLTIEGALRALAPASPLLLCALLALPFCQPIPMVGLSMPFGACIACLAIGILLGAEFKVPKRLGERRIPPHFFPPLLRASSRVVEVAERSLARRWDWVFHPWLVRTWASIILINAICLSLPLPVPFSNAFPAISVLALCLGSLKRDGLVVVVGAGAFAAALLFFASLAYAGVEFFA